MVETDSSSIDLLGLGKGGEEAVLPNEGQHSFTPPKSSAVRCESWHRAKGRAGGTSSQASWSQGCHSKSKLHKNKNKNQPNKK